MVTVLLVALVAMGTFAATLVGAAPPAGLPGGRAAELIGTDGHVEVLSGEGLFEQREWAHLYGPEAFSGPYEFFMVMSTENGLSMDEALATRWVRHTTTDLMGDQTHWLYSIDEAGLHTQLVVTEEHTITYVPARLEVPADVQPGMEWAAEGGMHVLGGDIHPYTSSAVAADAPEHGEGCLRITHTDLIGELGEVVQELVWCPRRGVVSDGGHTVAELDPAPRAPVEQAWDPTGWQLHEPTALQHAQGAMNISPLTAPLGVSGRSVALATSQDLVHFGSDWVLDSLSRPGGKLTAATQAEEFTLVATSHRTITATDPRHWLRWRVAVSDVVVQLIPAGFEHFVSVTSSGTVALRTLDSGEALWEHTFPGAADFTVTVREGRVFVTSGLQQATVLNQADGTTLATVDVTDRVVATGGGDDLLLVLVDTGRLFAYGPDGTPRWVAEVGGRRLTAELLVAGPEVVFGDEDMIVGLDADTGRVLWRRNESARAMATDGQYVVAYAQTHLTVLRGEETIHRWPLPGGYPVAEFWCRALPDGVTCIDGSGRISEAGP